MKIKRALIIRTVKAELIPVLMAEWKISLPEAEFDILTHYGQHNLKYFESDFRKIYIYKAVKDFYIYGLSLSEIKELRKQNYNAVIFPHRNPDYQGFSNVIILIMFLGAGKIFHSGPNGILKPLSRFVLIKLAAETVLTTLLFVIMLPISFLLLFIVRLFKK